MAKLMTKEEFIKNAVRIHGNKYDYSNTVPCGKRNKVCIICPEHGEFWQTQEHHLNGHGCPKCAAKERGEKAKERQLKTSEEFTKEAIEIHEDKYDYSKVNYNNSHTKVCIICPKHGEFWQTPNSHLRGVGCPKCGSIKAGKKLSLSKEEFIEVSNRIHGSKYDYSKVVYKNNKTKICIICPEHGEFWQSPHNHMLGKGCPLCGGTMLSTTEDFINKSNKIHGNKYDYSNVKYVNAKTMVCIICPEHGEFWQRPNNHLLGQGCPKCGHNGDGTRSDTAEFINKSKAIHGNKYDYSKAVYINNRLKVCIICPEHGDFWQVPAYHLSGNGCPKCKASWLEREISLYLNKHSIKYEYEKRFSWLGKKSLDFYLPEYNVAIECQGIQHFFPVQYFGGIEKYNATVARDVSKQNLCAENGVTLYYYTHEDFEGKNVYKNIDDLFGNINS